ncbi:Uma2 family endonuclease [Tolypothrix sp. FACHB-123]|uniref:Uma2 family endonuclease n=1 Tax=Tolypothrix sp. FACHB-123 TaxID=2692868 RepID=UPI0016843AAA|nr:Uma2 family endonuclease [Tolypothrix sp. FACHB-123]MBD2356934.1 Uma2 family endonuclease [Tolypothrix sp. FACHB-123]
MVYRIPSPTQSEVIYPDNDGQPVANNTIQFRWIVEIQQNLDWLFADDPNVFVAGDLFWYPVEGRNTIAVTPDVMVVLGRPKGDRLSYLQWKEEGIAPQVVFEILSPSNTAVEMDKKLLFFDRYGVEEYYIYDPDSHNLQGWLRGEDGLDVIPQMADWVSPRLKIKFTLSPEGLQLYRPDGERFLTYQEISQRFEQERQRAELEHERAEQEHERAEQERQRADRLAEQLRALGIEPEA